MNIADQINDVVRRVDLDAPGNIVVLTQSFSTTAEDRWHACTDPERLSRWFEPIEGDLHPHGRYRLVDSGTVGTIERCQRPHMLLIDWEYGEYVSRVEAVIESTGNEQATPTIRHFGSDNEHWNTYGPAAGGTGWDLSLLALARHLDAPHARPVDDVAAHMSTEIGQRQIGDFADLWRDAHIAAGADPDHAAAAANNAADGHRNLWSGTDA